MLGFTKRLFLFTFCSLLLASPSLAAVQCLDLIKAVKPIARAPLTPEQLYRERAAAALGHLLRIETSLTAKLFPKTVAALSGTHFVSQHDWSIASQLSKLAILTTFSEGFLGQFVRDTEYQKPFFIPPGKSLKEPLGVHLRSEDIAIQNPPTHLEPDKAQLYQIDIQIYGSSTLNFQDNIDHGAGYSYTYHTDNVSMVIRLRHKKSGLYVNIDNVPTIKVALENMFTYAQRFMGPAYTSTDSSFYWAASLPPVDLIDLPGFGEVNPRELLALMLLDFIK